MTKLSSRTRALTDLSSGRRAPINHLLSTLSSSVQDGIDVRSFQCTDLNSHRLLPSSSAPCPMNLFPKGMTSSALLWCEPCIRSGSCSSDLARFENLGLSAHDVQSPRAMEYLFADLQIPLPPFAYFAAYDQIVSRTRALTDLSSGRRAPINHLLSTLSSSVQDGVDVWSRSPVVVALRRVSLTLASQRLKPMTAPSRVMLSAFTAVGINSHRRVSAPSLPARHLRQ
ncbi:hypothetical protein DY000_02020401 [Brassica cretica]|uniref:Uncharacterized protein n=1 Tax=Brassica cretica TaxID=69181 RepID=A0ABQ7DZY5_BRACR|nr:hypothetical protein DY000_02020401 [Brassica cretica]